MDESQIRSAMTQCLARLTSLEPKRHDPSEKSSNVIEKLQHCKWMLIEMDRMLKEEQSIGKVFRWLGFVQGVMWSNGMGAIEDFKRMNMP